MIPPNSEQQAFNNSFDVPSVAVTPREIRNSIMGADAKRKEARKRKFEALTTDSLSNTKSGGGLLEATAHKFSRGTRVEKEDAGFSNTPTQTESTEEPSEADVSKPLDDTNGGEQDKVRQKSQRFIVFTGLYLTFPRPVLIVGLTDCDGIRKSAFHSYG